MIVDLTTWLIVLLLCVLAIIIAVSVLIGADKKDIERVAIRHVYVPETEQPQEPQPQDEDDEEEEEDLPFLID